MYHGFSLENSIGKEGYCNGAQVGVNFKTLFWYGEIGIKELLLQEGGLYLIIHGSHSLKIYKRISLFSNFSLTSATSWRRFVLPLHPETFNKKGKRLWQQQ